MQRSTEMNTENLVIKKAQWEIFWVKCWIVLKNCEKRCCFLFSSSCCIYRTCTLQNIWKILYYIKEIQMSPTEKTCLNPLFQKDLMEIFSLHLLTYLSHIWVSKILDSISRERWSNTDSIICITNTRDHFKTFFTSWLQKLRPKNTREASKMGHLHPTNLPQKDKFTVNCKVPRAAW